MIYISKVLKPWVYGCKSSMKSAYEECWRQKEVAESKLAKIKELRDAYDKDKSEHRYSSLIELLKEIDSN